MEMCSTPSSLQECCCAYQLGQRLFWAWRWGCSLALVSGRLSWLGRRSGRGGIVGGIWNGGVPVDPKIIQVIAFDQWEKTMVWGSYVLGNPKFKIWRWMMRNDFEECHGASSIPTTTTIIGYHYRYNWQVWMPIVIFWWTEPCFWSWPLTHTKMLLEMPVMVRLCLWWWGNGIHTFLVRHILQMEMQWVFSQRWSSGCDRLDPHYMSL